MEYWFSLNERNEKINDTNKKTHLKDIAIMYNTLLPPRKKD